jgi:hypothetical protein
MKALALFAVASLAAVSAPAQETPEMQKLRECMSALVSEPAVAELTATLGVSQDTLTPVQIFNDAYASPRDSGTAQRILSEVTRCGHPTAQIVKIWRGFAAGLFTYGETAMLLHKAVAAQAAATQAAAHSAPAAPAAARAAASIEGPRVFVLSTKYMCKEQRAAVAEKYGCNDMFTVTIIPEAERVASEQIGSYYASEAGCNAAVAARLNDPREASVDAYLATQPKVEALLHPHVSCKAEKLNP